jgi:hypothetical protein
VRGGEGMGWGVLSMGAVSIERGRQRAMCLEWGEMIGHERRGGKFREGDGGGRVMRGGEW